jgi:dihydropteroate synthase
MQEAPQYEDVVQEVASYLCSQALMLEEAGVAHERICLDPGVGFGKTAEHNLSLLAATEYLAQLGWPLMVAVSRKGFIGHITGVMQADKRCAGSVAAALYALRHGAAVARVHDVAPTVEALRMLQALDETHHASQVPCV